VHRAGVAIDGARQAEVNQDRTVASNCRALQQHVGWFDIAVQHTVSVRGGDSSHDLKTESQPLDDRWIGLALPLRQQLSQTGAIDEAHREEGASILNARFEDTGNARIVEPRQGFHFASQQAWRPNLRLA
tara:strand:+ start:1171 stop:1560 length:390 start_codon:yes stop_codon:yes gene_type:complete